MHRVWASHHGWPSQASTKSRLSLEKRQPAVGQDDCSLRNRQAKRKLHAVLWHRRSEPRSRGNFQNHNTLERIIVANHTFETLRNAVQAKLRAATEQLAAAAEQKDSEWLQNIQSPGRQRLVFGSPLRQARRSEPNWGSICETKLNE